MIVDGLEVFGLDDVSIDTLIGIEHRRYVAHHVFDELRIVVSALGHIFLVGTLEETVELAGSLFFGDSPRLLSIQRSWLVKVKVTWERSLCAPRSDISWSKDTGW